MKTRTLARCFAGLALVLCSALSVAAEPRPDALTPDGGRYYGPIVDGRFNGQGRIVYPDGRKYSGDFLRAEYHGQGRYEDSDGNVYEGQFVRGVLTGKGTQVNKAGGRYDGDFVKWRMHGNGKFVDPQGNVYEGQFVDGALEGRGRFIGKDGTSYAGEFKQWRFHGRGVQRLANGDAYEGAFEYGWYEGQGTLKYAKPRADGRTQDAGLFRHGVLAGDRDQRRIMAGVESALYTQRALLDRALASIAPRRSGVINLYLLAVAGDGSQEVFRREVEFVRAQFDRRFGTAGRSLTLVNSRSAADVPMATVTSIRESLKRIASRMDRDQDILFLFLTSHGSRTHELTLNQNGMDLPGLEARRLGELLRESGIRWKVIVVSACYSGGFIDHLKDQSTLVITAARRDRTSFGCADENDFTYFGRAFFKEALPQSASFEQAFRKARSLVDEWEVKDRKASAGTARESGGKELGSSMPQIHEPEPIKAQLRRWWSQNESK